MIRGESALGIRAGPPWPALVHAMFFYKNFRRCVYTKKAAGSALLRLRVLEKRSQQAGNPTSLFKLKVKKT